MCKLTNEEMAKRIKAGDSTYLPALWDNIYKLIYRIINRQLTGKDKLMLSNGVTIEDVQQECYFAFLKAIEAYKSDSEYKFTAYFNYCIKNTVNELLGLRKTTATNPLNLCTSLDIPLADTEDITLQDTIPDDNAQKPFEAIDEADYLQALRRNLDRAIAECLNKREQSTITGHYFESKTYAELASSFNVSKSRIFEHNKAALRKLRNSTILTEYKTEYKKEITERNAYNGSGLNAFRNNRASSVELAYEQWKKLKRDLERERIAQYYRTWHG